MEGGREGGEGKNNTTHKTYLVVITSSWYNTHSGALLKRAEDGWM